jgi:hypothetical protein
MGTSATLGTAESRDDLCAYAQRIFGEDFDNDAVIGEQRQTVGEFLEDVFTSVLGVPGPAHELRPEAHTGLESYLRAQHRLWFGADIRLTSVMLGSLFATPFGEEDDRQVIAFSDSVQDAAHRAGFFGARTYRFNFRTALQRASEAAGEGVSLAELTDRTTRFWQQILGDDVRYVGTFLPSDLEWLHGWNELRETGKLVVINLICSELSIGAWHGRSCPSTGFAPVSGGHWNAPAPRSSAPTREGSTMPF